ncbi:MAG TPA: glycosyl transferase family 28, partial [Afifellaceae bacterium]|nr:glycosyl transferase family 28 [Afifellaceae bacterium]
MDAEIQAERDRFEKALQAARAADMSLPFWWRDDDAVEVTPQLEELLALREAARVPLALAVIPKFAQAELMERIRLSGCVSVLQHGWAHEKHSPPGEKASEFGESRPLEA